jgi:rSAM/selenodomain-associated transferase 1
VVIIMAKQPAVGRTKTRLCPPLTPAQAAAFYEALLLDTITLVHDIPSLRLAVTVTPTDATIYFQRVSPPGTILVPVECETIGGCLCQALGYLLDLGHPQAIALNSDGPSLPPAYLVQARVELASGADVVLGPSEDGGYYLIGLNRPHPELFENIEWSTAWVTAQTLARAHALGLQVAILPQWYDVDGLADLQRLKAELDGSAEGSLTHTRRYFETHSLPAGI